MSGGGKGDSPHGNRQPPAEKAEGASLFKRRGDPKGLGRIRPSRESGKFSWLVQQQSDLLTHKHIITVAEAFCTLLVSHDLSVLPFLSSSEPP